MKVSRQQKSAKTSNTKKDSNQRAKILETDALPTRLRRRWKRERSLALSRCALILNAKLNSLIVENYRGLGKSY